MEKLKRNIGGFRFKGIVIVALIFAVIGVICFVERSGISYNYQHRSIGYMPNDKTLTKQSAWEDIPKTDLLLWNSDSVESVIAYREFEVTYKDMKIGYIPVDLAKEEVPSFDGFEAITILLVDLEPMGDKVLDIADFVREGGGAYFALTLRKNLYSAILESMMGIAEASYENAPVESIYVDADFMVGGGRSFAVPDPFDSALALQLTERARVYAYTDDDKRVPLIWECPYGEGKFVVNNFGLYEKVTRGFFAASYSLLKDVVAYPVINASTFFLDDFPSQIPSGSSEYIERDYNTTIRDFYVNIWWPDMMNFTDRYGVKYTGLAIECYDDAVDGTTSPAPDKGTFLNFGNMLMRQGGEIGYHGYNHQPLCLADSDYRGIYDYKTWDSTAAMKGAFDALVDFCEELFPDVNMSVYVPPSNLLSDVGREFLISEYPQIRTISGIYLPDDELDFACIQEYNVDENGIVDLPRVAAGCELDEFTRLGIMSELNLHFANSHFTHPDDSLDPERGAELGWERLKQGFNDYLSWLYSSAPMIRNFTASETSGAIQRYVAVNVSLEQSDDKLVMRIGNFYDEAWLLVRFNKGEPLTTDGGRITRVTGNLYLVEAKQDTVTVFMK